jgi:hypothetical protein
MPGLERYGVDFRDPEMFGEDPNFSEAMIELWMMVSKRGLSDGALGEHGHLKKAMMLLWPSVYAGEVAPGVPRWRDEIDLLTWAWVNYRFTAVIGHASAGKTHTFGHLAACYYIADCMNTIITLTSTHLPGLRKRLWADTVSAIRSAQIAPGVLGIDYFAVRSHDMSIRPLDGLNADKYIIEGIATDRGQEAVEKIQGNHSRKNRFVIIDEAQGTPGAIFDASANLLTDQDFRMAMLANPTRRYSEFGTWCEPEDGWAKIDPETDTHWETSRGGVCLRLDGLRSPNIKTGIVYFPFLIRPEYLDQVRKGFGEGSPRWWTYVRGWFAPEGLAGVVCPQNVIQKAEKKVQYDLPPRKIAALDPAFEGGDQCVLMFGEYGDSRGSRFALNVTKSVPLKLAISEKSDPLDYLIAHETMEICKTEGVKPDDFIMDVTGAGRGVWSILTKEWGPIQRCGFGDACSERQVRASEPEPAKDLFDRFVSELWWAARVWMDENMVGGLDISQKLLREQLVARQYETVRDKKISIEKKKDMKNRLGYSPDEADAFVMLIELVRRAGGVAGSANVHPHARDNQRKELAIRLSESLGAGAEFS